jgi:hypothetical protein
MHKKELLFLTFLTWPQAGLIALNGLNRAARVRERGRGVEFSSLSARWDGPKKKM